MSAWSSWSQREGDGRMEGWFAVEGVPRPLPALTHLILRTALQCWASPFNKGNLKFRRLLGFSEAFQLQVPILSPGPCALHSQEWRGQQGGGTALLDSQGLSHPLSVLSLETLSKQHA